MTKILKNPSLVEIKDAVENNLFFWASKEKEVKNSQINFIEKEEYSIFQSKLPIPLGNMVYKTNFSSEQLEEKIEGVIQYFKDLNHPFVWFTGDQTRPTNLQERLVSEYNFKMITNPGMYFNTKHLKEIEVIENLQILRVETKEQLEDWINVLLESFEMKHEGLRDFFLHWLEHKKVGSSSAFIGYYEGKAVSISAIYYGAGVAGIYCVGTIKEARKKGIGTAVTLAAVKEAKERGYEIVILHSSEMGYNAYKRMGFEEVCKVNKLVWSPE